MESKSTGATQVLRCQVPGDQFCFAGIRYEVTKFYPATDSLKAAISVKRLDGKRTNVPLMYLDDHFWLDVKPMHPKSTRGGARPGAGRKPRDTQQVVLRLSPATIERLHARAAELGITLSDLAERRLRKA